MADYQWTYPEHPEAWDDGASWLIKARVGDDYHVWANGWHKRQILFEHPELELEETPEDLSSYQITQFIAEFSLDLIDDNDPLPVLQAIVNPEDASALLKVCKQSSRVSANRSARVTAAEAQADILVTNMPARNGSTSEKLRCIKRWCHVFKFGDSSITIYSPLQESEKNELRWPHYAVWLNRPTSWYSKDTPIPESAFDEEVLIPIEYNAYNMKNWRIEREAWETQTFLAENDNQLEKCRRDFRALAEFANNIALSARSLRRKNLDSNVAFYQRHQRLQTKVEDGITSFTKWLTESRKELLEDSRLLSETAQTVQAHSSNQLNELIERMSAIFIIPTIIIAFFQMNILTASESVGWCISIGVFVFCVIAALITMRIIHNNR